jgi:hypothetical protein
MVLFCTTFGAASYVRRFLWCRGCTWLVCHIMLCALSLILAAPKLPAISPSQLANLRRTKQDVFLPTWLPKGMKSEINVNLDKQRDLVYYSVTYRAGKQEFTLQTASEGIGDIFLEDDNGPLNSETGSAVIPGFGKVEIEFQKKPNGKFVVNWLDRGAKKWPHFVGFLGGGMDQPTVKRILASVRKV